MRLQLDQISSVLVSIERNKTYLARTGDDTQEQIAVDNMSVVGCKSASIVRSHKSRG